MSTLGSVCELRERERGGREKERVRERGERERKRGRERKREMLRKYIALVLPNSYTLYWV